MLPVITVVGLEFAFLVGGLVVTEQVFNLDELGMLFVDAVTHYDYTLVQGLTLGTDTFGHDVLSRIIIGSRTALLVGFCVSASAGASTCSSSG